MKKPFHESNFPCATKANEREFELQFQCFFLKKAMENVKRKVSPKVLKRISILFCGEILFKAHKLNLHVIRS